MCSRCAGTWDSPSFVGALELMLEQHAQLEQQRTALSAVDSLWEEVKVLRNELETRLARAELRLRGVEVPSTAELLDLMSENALLWDAAWADVEARVEAVTALESRTREAWLDTGDWPVQVVRTALDHAREAAPSRASSAALTSSSTRARLPLPSPRATEPTEVMLRLRLVRVEPQWPSLLVELDTHRRRVSPQAPLACFAAFEPTSTVRIRPLLDHGGPGDAVVECCVQQLLESSGDVLRSHCGQLALWVAVDRASVGRSPGRSAAAMRGGTHVAVPRFVNTLKRHKEFRASCTEDAQRCRARDITQQVLSDHPDLAWLEETVLQPGFDATPEYNSKRQSLLHLMCMGGGVQAVRKLLRSPAKKWDPNARDVNGWTPFMMIVSRQNVEGLTMMLLHGCSANDFVSGGVTALHMAALSGKTELVATLLDHGAHVNSVDDQLATALHYAAYAHRDAVLAQLLEAANVDVNPRDSIGQTPLTVAIRRKSPASMHALLSSGRCMLTSAELVAALEGDAPLLARLLQAIPTDSLHAFMMDALASTAADELCARAMTLMLRSGMDVAGVVPATGRTLLLEAASAGKGQCFAIALSHPSTQLTWADARGNTVLHLIRTAALFDDLMEVLPPVDAELLFRTRNADGLLPHECALGCDVQSAMSAWAFQ